MYSEKDLQRNNIVKKLGVLLKQIDPRVRWADYITEGETKNGHALVAIGTESGTVKYLNISGKSPFKLVNEVLNAMDDFRLDVQFMNVRQLEEVKDDIIALAKSRAKIANDTLEILKEGVLSRNDCKEIVLKAQEAGIFPEFFPKNTGEVTITAEMIEKFLKTTAATFIDTQIIAELVEEQFAKYKEYDTHVDEDSLEI